MLARMLLTPSVMTVKRGVGVSLLMLLSPHSSLRGADGSRECAPDDRLRDEAIHTCIAARWIASLALAMTGKISRSVIPGASPTRIRNDGARVQTQLIKARMPRRQRGTGLRSSSERVC